MRYGEKNAREYCASINSNPDESVPGYLVTGPIGSRPEKIFMPRWQWYVGAKVEQRHVHA